MTDEEYCYLTRKIRKLTGIELNNYKNRQMRRRLEHLLLSSNFADVISYCSLLENDPTMVEKLKDFLTINVSEFFRDPKYFHLLMTDILPEMLKQRTRLTIWSAGCSNGAEPYSVAMILDQLSPFSHHRILATDIDQKCLEKAKDGGPYYPNEVRNVPAHFFGKYLVETEDGYKVTEKIRQSVIFKQHDLLQDPVDEKFDLILCRNVLIYLTEQAKYSTYQKLHHALRENGILFVGAAEIILNPAAVGFEIYSPLFYRKLTASQVCLATVKTAALLSTRKSLI